MLCWISCISPRSIIPFIICCRGNFLLYRSGPRIPDRCISRRHPSVESYSLIFEGYGHEGNKYRNLLSHGLSADSIALAEKIDGKDNLWNYILRWPIVHTRYRELTQYDFVQYEPSVYGRGSVHGWTIGYGPDLENQISCTDTAELSEDNKEWLDRMFALSRENGFDLIFCGPHAAVRGQSADHQCRIRVCPGKNILPDCPNVWKSWAFISRIIRRAENGSGRTENVSFPWAELIPRCIFWT